MSRASFTLRQVIDELANALQAAIGLAGNVRRNAKSTADDAVLLEASIARAVSALKRLPPNVRRRTGGGR
jgi:hypothetical protein